MAKSNKHSILEFYYVDEDFNNIVADLHGELVDIELSEFKDWLSSSDHLECTADHADHAGNHVQKTNKIAIDDFFDLSSAWIEEALLDFINETEKYKISLNQ